MAARSGRDGRRNWQPRCPSRTVASQSGRGIVVPISHVNSWVDYEAANLAWSVPCRSKVGARHSDFCDRCDWRDFTWSARVACTAPAPAQRISPGRRWALRRRVLSGTPTCTCYYRAGVSDGNKPITSTPAAPRVALRLQPNITWTPNRPATPPRDPGNGEVSWSRLTRRGSTRMHRARNI